MNAADCVIVRQPAALSGGAGGISAPFQGVFRRRLCLSAFGSLGHARFLRAFRKDAHVVGGG